MIIARFEVRSRPECSDELAAALAAVEAPSRELPGVVHFDVARSLTDPNAFVVLEVFEDRQALERQEEQAEVAAVLSLVEAGALACDFEWTVWDASATEEADRGPVGERRSPRVGAATDSLSPPSPPGWASRIR